MPPLDVKGEPGSLWCNPSQIHVSIGLQSGREEKKSAGASAPRSLDALLGCAMMSNYVFLERAYCNARHAPAKSGGGVDVPDLALDDRHHILSIRYVLSSPF
jgi:hypothetical protein